MFYTIKTWKEGNVWCAETPDKDIFRHTDLVHAIGEIFKRVTAAAQYVPCQLMNESIEETGRFMVQHAANYAVRITDLDLNNPKMNPSHPLNLYQSLVTGTR